MVEFGLVPYPSCVEVIVVLVLCLASCVEVVVLREELYTPSLYLPNPQWRFPVWEVLCGRSENLSV